MHVTRKVAHWIEELTQSLDKRNRRTLVQLVLSASKGRTLSVSRLGRHLVRTALPKHAIKRVDRWLSNRAVQRSVDAVYAELTAKLIRPGSRPVMVVDWTESGPKHYALVAAVAVGGRAMTIRCEVYARHYVNNRYREQRFLRRLHRSLPSDCRPIVLTDAGFKTPWFRAVQRLGWDFVGRLSCQTRVQPEALGTFERVDSFYRRQHSVAVDYGPCRVTQSSHLHARCVQYKEKPKGRHGARRPSRKGTHPKADTFRKYQKRAREPWMLVTSLMQVQPSTVVKYYRARMQIEQTFRDSKNHRYGLSFEDVRCRLEKRANVIWLLASLTLYVAYLLGTVLEHHHQARAWQANTLAHRRVLSRVFLGLLVLQSLAHVPLEHSACQRALRCLQYACNTIHLQPLVPP